MTNNQDRFRWSSTQSADSAQHPPSDPKPAPPTKPERRPPITPVDVSGDRGFYDNGYPAPEFGVSSSSLAQSQSEQHFPRWSAPQEQRDTRDSRRSRGRDYRPRKFYEDDARAQGPPRGGIHLPKRTQPGPPQRGGRRPGRSVSDTAIADRPVAPAPPPVTDWQPTFDTCKQ
jgi:hypothetical protein